MVIPADLPEFENLPPIADIAGDHYGSLTFNDTGKSGAESVTLDGSTSSDPDGFIQSYSWSWSGSDGTAGTASGASISAQLQVGPSYDFTLTVIDNQAASSPESCHGIRSAEGRWQKRRQRRWTERSRLAKKGDSDLN